jgi:Domain of unknown function (DUF4157)
MFTHSNQAKTTANLSSSSRSVSKNSGSHTIVLAKPGIGLQDDTYAIEADAMADRAVRTQDSNTMNFSSSTNSIRRKCAHCEEEEQKEQLQRKETSSESMPTAPSMLSEALNSSGNPMDSDTRSFMESRFQYDFSSVKIHDSDLAAKSASSINALAYTSGNNIVFNSGQYNTSSESGKRLLAHELTHVVQQQSADNSSLIRRVPCTPAATCSGGPITGSAQEADITGTSHEAGPRERRRKMTPARAVATGHGGRALQLERFFESQAPGRLANLQGIFIDQDIASDFGATTISCATWIADSLPSGSPVPPGMAGATRLCTFVHDFLNQQALAFNTTSAPTIGGVPRERWRAETLEMLIHESEHPRYEAATSANPAPAGVTSPDCTRGNIIQELSEIAAILSEFQTAIRAANSETNSTGPLHQSWNAWFNCKFKDCGENIKAALEQIGCHCSCPEVDAFVIETFNFESASWTVAERDAFHREIRKATYGIRWPLSPSVP